MNKIMTVYMAKADELESEACAQLTLPATPYELFDALDRARIREGDELYFEVEEIHEFEYMEPFVSGTDNLLELNALCQKLSELDARQSAAFDGLLLMDLSKKGGPVTVGRLIDLAYSTDCCHVVEEALNDSQLGRFYAENGFVPDTDNLPDKVFNLLDFERIGREQRRGEGGAFTKQGYVVRDGELSNVSKDMRFTMQTPEYQILLALPDGNRLALPCDAPPKADSHTCLDCRIPQLMDAINEADIGTVNTFAATLKDMGDQSVQKFKAVLTAEGCDSVQGALALGSRLDKVVFEGAITDPHALALDELRYMMREEDAELLAQFTNLTGYGKAILERDHSVITPYGLVEHGDRHQVLTESEEVQSPGMEMM